MDDYVDYFKPLEDKLAVYLDSKTLATVRRAYVVAEQAHSGQKRRTGEDYITHPIAAAEILADIQMEPETIMATILHDVIEDTDVSKSDLAAEFGDQVAELVDGVSKLTQIKFSSRAEAQAENFRKMVMAMVRDIRVIIVKLADRLHNMRTLGVMPHEKRRRIARETLEIYAPIAHRLGIHPFFTELEDLGFKTLHPLRYQVLKKVVQEAKKKRKQTVEHIIQRFSETLKERGVDDFSVYHRNRHLYSIYKKIKIKTASFTEIMDIYGFRIVVEKPDDCYRGLGAVHFAFTPRPDYFRDYIAIPKANGYQALHTTLFGPHGVPIEVQVRTNEMEDIAEHGVASRWIHKNDFHHDPTESRAKRWVKNLLEMQQSSSDSVDFIETVKKDLFPKEVYVFTPEGDIIELPHGSTPVDFAYAIHSDVGNTCVAAKVDRMLSALSQVLKNGQTVEVITAVGATPNPSWLNFIVSGKARSNIKHYLKNQQLSESARLGRRMLENILGDLGYEFDDVSDERLASTLEIFKVKHENDLFAEIGMGNVMPLVAADKLLPQLAATRGTQLDFEKAQQITPLVLKGTEGMIVKFAECCHPVPGDHIVGCMQAGQGILVHIENCQRVKQFRNKADSFIALRWEEQVEGEFNVNLNIEVANRRGVLAMIATCISDTQANIVNVGVDPRDGKHNEIKLLIGVKDSTHLQQVIHRLKQLAVVNNVTRI